MSQQTLTHKSAYKNAKHRSKFAALHQQYEGNIAKGMKNKLSISQSKSICLPLTAGNNLQNYKL
jgi:hypothetical protein